MDLELPGCPRSVRFGGGCLEGGAAAGWLGMGDGG